MKEQAGSRGELFLGWAAAWKCRGRSRKNKEADEEGRGEING